jgi:hypothetical protein
MLRLENFFSIFPAKIYHLFAVVGKADPFDPTTATCRSIRSHESNVQDNSTNKNTALNSTVISIPLEQKLSPTLVHQDRIKIERLKAVFVAAESTVAGQNTPRQSFKSTNSGSNSLAIPQSNDSGSGDFSKRAQSQVHESIVLVFFKRLRNLLIRNTGTSRMLRSTSFGESGGNRKLLSTKRTNIIT